MSDKQSLESILFNIYYNPNSTAAFSTPERLFKYVRQNYEVNVSKSQILEWMRKQRTFTLHKDRRTKFSRNHYIITNIDDLWEMDLIDMQKFSRNNKSCKYILAVIDCFSKFAWCVPIKRKTPDEIIKAFDCIFANTTRRPIKIQSDKGREFVNRNVKKYFECRDINFFTTRDPATKAAICERFIRTIKGIIYKYFTHTNCTRYYEVLDSLVFLYNNRVHSTIGTTPASVNETNILDVWKHTQKKQQNIRDKRDRREPKLHVGDIVKVSNTKSIFDKGYKPKWSDETFSIVKVLMRRPVVYHIKDNSGSVIKGNFYESELQKIE